MGKDIRYLVVKKKNTQEIVYMEYDKLEGYEMTPKNKKPFEDSIHVNRMIIIQPTLIEGLVHRQVRQRFEKLLRFIALMYETEDDSGTTIQEVLNEIERFRIEVKNKYRAYMAKEELHLLAKKLILLQNEAKLRLDTLQNQLLQEKSGKSR